MVPGGCHDKIFGVKFETVKLIGGRLLFAVMSGPNGRVWKVSYGLDYLKVALCVCLNHTDGGIYSDHGYLETLEIPGGPP